MGCRADEYMPLGPIHENRLTVTILNAESAARVGPFNILKLVADNSAGAAFNTAFVGEEHAAIILGCVAGGWATVDALLADAFEARIGIDDADMGPRAIDVIGVERQLSFDCGWIEDVSSLQIGFRPYGCGHVWHCPIMATSAQCRILPRASVATGCAILACLDCKFRDSDQIDASLELRVRHCITMNNLIGISNASSLHLCALHGIIERYDNVPYQISKFRRKSVCIAHGIS